MGEVIALIVMLILMFIVLPMWLFLLFSEEGEFSSPKEFVKEFVRTMISILTFESPLEFFKKKDKGKKKK